MPLRKSVAGPCHEEKDLGSAEICTDSERLRLLCMYVVQGMEQRGVEDSQYWKNASYIRV